METAAEALSQTNFSPVDWVIIICYPMISLVIGLVVRKYVANMKDFVTAGQSLGTCLGVATITGTELGLITVMYSAEKGFTGGFAAFHIALAAGIGNRVALEKNRLAATNQRLTGGICRGPGLISRRHRRRCCCGQSGTGKHKFSAVS